MAVFFFFWVAGDVLLLFLLFYLGILQNHWEEEFLCTFGHMAVMVRP